MGGGRINPIKAFFTSCFGGCVGGGRTEEVSADTQGRSGSIDGTQGGGSPFSSVETADTGSKRVGLIKSFFLKLRTFITGKAPSSPRARGDEVSAQDETISTEETDPASPPPLKGKLDINSGKVRPAIIMNSPNQDFSRAEFIGMVNGVDILHALHSIAKRYDGQKERPKMNGLRISPYLGNFSTHGAGSTLDALKTLLDLQAKPAEGKIKIEGELRIGQADHVRPAWGSEGRAQSPEPRPLEALLALKAPKYASRVDFGTVKITAELSRDEASLKQLEQARKLNFTVAVETKEAEFPLVRTMRAVARMIDAGVSVKNVSFYNRNYYGSAKDDAEIAEFNELVGKLSDAGVEMDVLQKQREEEWRVYREQQRSRDIYGE